MVVHSPEPDMEDHHGPRYQAVSAPPQRPKKAWAMNTQATPIVVPSAAVPQPPKSPKIYSPTVLGQAKVATQSSPVPKTETPLETRRPVAVHSSAENVVEKKPRIQSAPSQRPTGAAKIARPVKSAGESICFVSHPSSKCIAYFLIGIIHYG